MKKVGIIISLILSQLLSFANYTGTVTTNLNDLNFTSKNGFDIISLPDEQYTEEIGSPQLPVKILSFLIPFDKVVSNIVINATTVQQLTGTYNVYPVQTPTIVPDAFPFDNPNPAIYNSTNLYPNIQYLLTDDGYPMGYHVVTIKFFPLQYEPATQLLNLYTSIDFTIELANNNIIDILRPNRQSIYSNNLSKTYVQSLVVNPYDINSVGGGAKQVVGSGSTSPNMKGMSPTEIINIPDYIIITSNDLIGNSLSGFQKLADWKTQKGVSTLIIKTEDIYSNYSGDDNAEKIRNYLKDAYINFGSTYVLLGGDVKDDNGSELIPVREVQIFNPSSLKDNFKETDFYYATVQGSWNANGNNIYGEMADNPNYSSVFFVGRAPVRNLSEATNFSNKVINYENLKDLTGVTLSNLNYVKNLSFMDELAGHSALNALDAPTGIIPPSSNYHALKLYNSTNGYFLLNKTNAMNAINTGWDNFGQSYGKIHLFYHMDHSGFDMMTTGSGSGGGGIGIVDMDNITNDGYNSIWYTDGCHPNDFVQNSVSKHFINNVNGGGVAFIGNVSSGYTGNYIHFTKYFMNALYSSTKLSGIQNFDNANYHIGYLKWWASVNYGWDYLKNRNLLGDPEMMVWTDSPKNLIVTSIYSDVTKEITGTVSGLTFASTSTVVVTVTAWKGNEIWTTTDISATTPNIPFTLSNVIADTPGDITLTVTAHNYIPNVSLINVPSPIVGAHPYKTDSQIIDDGTLGSTGNGDNYPDAGETISLPITLTNSGTSMATNVTATLSWTADSYQTQSGASATIVINNNSSVFGNISAGATANNNASEFTFTINKDAFDGIIPRPLTQFLNFTLDIYVNGVLFSSKPFAVEIGEPQLIKGENTVTGVSPPKNSTV